MQQSTFFCSCFCAKFYFLPSKVHRHADWRVAVAEAAFFIKASIGLFAVENNFVAAASFGQIAQKGYNGFAQTLAC